jgi:mono/diheme cytochrome c family protein
MLTSRVRLASRLFGQRRSNPTVRKPAMTRTTGLLIAVLSLTSLAQADSKPILFERDVRPIFKAHCWQCHGEEEKPEAALDLRLVRFMLKGGDSGPAVVAGKPAESLIWKRIAAGEMPPQGKGLSDQEKQTLAAWIEQGAQTTRPEPETIVAGSDWTEEERGWWAFQPVKRPAIPDIRNRHSAAGSSAGSLRTSRSELRTPVDAFLLAKLAEKGLEFSPEADRRTLARRLTFDLWGLPPTPELVDRFVADASPDAYERLVEELLASPLYGERWARHWLDAAGYADSDGYTEADRERPWAFRYRDYVIRSFNDDKPFDQFIVEQLAGDELLTPTYQNLSADDADKLIATGFLRMAPDGTGQGGVDANVARNDVVAETIKIVSTSLMGLTVGCAQCHMHRYDPISQQDYYRFRAIFEPALDWKNWRDPPGRLVNLWTPAEHEQAARVDQELREIEGQRLAELDGIVNEVFDKEVAKLAPEKQQLAREARKAEKDQRTPEQQQILKEHPSLNVDRGSVYLYEGKRLQEFNKKYEQLNAETRARRPADSFVACLTEPPGHKPLTYLFYRGDFNQPREVIAPGTLSILPDAAPIAEDDPNLPTTGRRLAFARHLTSGKHPLLARVLVNRVWMNHFGRGLVASPGDFGQLGERPSHPELLDWLAAEFVAEGQGLRGKRHTTGPPDSSPSPLSTQPLANPWSLKRLHRLIVNSSAYRQVSTRSEALQAVDPENRWLGRMSVRRLEAEAIRDAMLEVAGLRTGTMFGPPSSVNPDDVGQIIVGKATRDGNGILVAKFEDSPEQFRRSVYVQVRRSLPLAIMEPFDIATLSPNCERRSSSTVAPQALLMMNNDLVVRLSERFAQRVLSEAGDDPAAQVRLAWRLACGRDADAELTAEALAFLEKQRQNFAPASADVKPDAAKPVPPSPALQALALLCQALLSSNQFLYVE